MAATTRNGTSPSQESHAVKSFSTSSNKLTSVLSSSFVDADTRNALRLFDARYSSHVQDNSFDLKYEAQKEVIQANGKIVDDFARVAQVCLIVQPKAISSLTEVCSS